jgi:hypothetical protein
MHKSVIYSRTHLVLALVAVLILGVVNAPAQTKRKRPIRRGTATAKKAATRIPVGTEMKIRLQNEIDTKAAQDGDKFTAVVLSPAEYADGMVEGHIAKIKKSGKLTGKTELSLAFDSVKLKSGEIVPFAAQVVKVYGEDSAKSVDEEGNVQSGSKGKTTAIRSGGGAALGAIVGGIAGGGKGAAIGAAIGAGAGAGSTYIQGSNKVKLDSGTEILIKSTR